MYCCPKSSALQATRYDAVIISTTMPQYLHDHIKLHRIHFSEVNELYISLSLRAFAIGLVGIFVPIYLLVLGFSLNLIAGFFIVMFGIKALIHPLTAWMSARYGPKHIVVFSYIASFIYIMMLFVLPQYMWLLYPAALIGGVADGWFWLARHIDWAAVAGRKKASSEYSWLLIFSNIAMAMAPLVGGVVASAFGIGYALLGAGAGLLLAIYPLLKTLEPAVPRSTNLSLFKVAPWQHLAANFAMNFQSVVSVLFWPIFIYLIVLSYDTLGVIASASLLLVLLTTWFLGRLGDGGKNTQVLKSGTRLRTLVHIARVPVQSFPAAMAVNVVGDVTDMLASAPYSIRYYEAARRHGIVAYLVDMEIVGDIAKAASWALLWGLYALFGLSAALIITFVLAAVLMPLLRWIEFLPRSMSGAQGHVA